MTTPPCSAITKSGTVCGRTTGTQPDPDTGEPRCYTHIAKARRLANPAARPPVRNPRSAEDVKRLAAWVMIQAATNQLSAPSSNAVARAAQLWLRAHESRVEEGTNAVMRLARAILDLGRTWQVPPDQQARYRAACERLQAAMDHLDALQPPPRESTQDEAARAGRQRAREVDSMDEDADDDALSNDLDP